MLCLSLQWINVSILGFIYTSVVVLSYEVESVLFKGCAASRPTRRALLQPRALIGASREQEREHVSPSSSP